MYWSERHFHTGLTFQTKNPYPCINSIWIHSNIYHTWFLILMHMSVSFPNSLCKQQDEEQYVFHVNEHPPKAALNDNLKLAPDADKPIELSNPSSTADVFTDKSLKSTPYYTITRAIWQTHRIIKQQVKKTEKQHWGCSFNFIFSL